MPRSIGVFGAGSGLGHAIARRYAQEGYDIVLVARRREPLDLFAQDLIGIGARVHVATADLADTAAIPALAERIRAETGELDVLYYAPTPDQGFVPAAELTPKRAEEYMPLVFYSLVALVQEFLPHMVEEHSGAILTAQGASTLHGLPNMSGPGPAQAAQRNYLQSLRAEVSAQGVYIGALIENSAFHSQTEEARIAGRGRNWGPTVKPDYLADMLWRMNSAEVESEAIYPGEESSMASENVLSAETVT